MQKELICRGSIGDVYRHHEGVQVIAVKILDSRKSSRLVTSVDAIFAREVRALKAVSQRNIVFLLSPEQLSPGEFEISMTYCPGDSLFDLLHKRRGLTLSSKPVKKIISDLVGALNHLHTRANPIIHGDIKSLNILLMSEIGIASALPWLKLCDFGSARFSDDPVSNGTITVGTVQWMAPEVMTDTSYGPPSDIYSFGMVLYETCLRRIPFTNYPENAVMGKVIKGERPEVSL
jgi:serine/threonine protein kinase